MSGDDDKCLDVLSGRDMGTEKARDFLAYVFDRTLSGLSMARDDDVSRLLKKCALLLPEGGFPFKKSDGTMLIIPAGMVLDELLYSDMPMTLFFMKFAEFHLLLFLLKERYPAFFSFIIKKSCPVPETLPGDSAKAAERILRHYFEISRVEKTGEKKQSNKRPASTPKPAWERDPVLFRLVRALTVCRYLPLSMDYTPYNTEIISRLN
jgi:hypothetical protein